MVSCQNDRSMPDFIFLPYSAAAEAVAKQERVFAIRPYPESRAGRGGWKRVSTQLTLPGREKGSSLFLPHYVQRRRCTDLACNLCLLSYRVSAQGTRRGIKVFTQYFAPAFDAPRETWTALSWSSIARSILRRNLSGFPLSYVDPLAPVERLAHRDQIQVISRS